MYIQKVKLQNFRSFGDEGICFLFNKGINAVIGENNNGKTALIDAIRIAFSCVLYKKDIFFSKTDFHVNAAGERAAFAQIDVYLKDVPQNLIEIWDPMAAIFIQATYIMIPLFLQMNKLNLLNSLTALGVLYATMQFPFAIFLLTGFLRSIPRDYEEAAMIDGCGPFRILTSIIIPMCKPGIVTVCMISAMAAWNEYPVALVMVTDPTKATLPVGLANLYEIQRYATDWGALFAALVLALIPTVILFIVGQKQLVQGLSVGGVKG